MTRLFRIARREYFSYLRTPGFWLSLLIAPLIALFAGVSPNLMRQATPLPVVTIVDFSGGGAAAQVAHALRDAPATARLVAPPLPVQQTHTPDDAARALRPYLHGQIDVALVLYGAPDRVAVDYWSRDQDDPSLPDIVSGAVKASMQQARLRSAGLDPRLMDALAAMQPHLRLLSPKRASGRTALRDRLPSLLGLGLGYVLFFAIFTGAGILLNSVIEEKASRILEVLLSSASLPEILGGKIAGALALSITVIGGWAVIGAAALARSSPALLEEVAGALIAQGLIVWFALFFLAGYILYAAVFAAIGAFCETVREAQTLLGPLMLVVTIPVLFLNLAVQHPGAPLMVVLSWVPPFAPFLMTARLASGLPLWQILGPLALVVATAAGVIWLSARAFRTGALATGRLGVKRLATLVFASRAGVQDPSTKR